MAVLACYQCLAPVYYEAGERVVECPRCHARLELAYRTPRQEQATALPGRPARGDHATMHLRFPPPRMELHRRLHALAWLRYADLNELTLTLIQEGLDGFTPEKAARLPLRRPHHHGQMPGGAA